MFVFLYLGEGITLIFFDGQLKYLIKYFLLYAPVISNLSREVGLCIKPIGTACNAV